VWVGALFTLFCVSGVPDRSPLHRVLLGSADAFFESKMRLAAFMGLPVWMLFWLRP
jgi:hypothetical protein